MLKKDRSEIYLSFDVNGKHLLFIYVKFFSFKNKLYFINIISNVGKMNVDNDAKLLQMEAFLTDNQYHFKNSFLKKEADDM